MHSMVKKIAVVLISQQIILAKVTSKCPLHIPTMILYKVICLS